MSGDRLAQIEERKSFYDEDGEWVYLSAEERDALVEIAKAARRLDEHMGYNGGCHVGCPEHDDLRSALARLDSGATEEDA